MNDLIKRCITHTQRRFFQALGMALGNEKWAGDVGDMQKEVEEMGGAVSKHSPAAESSTVNANQVSLPLVTLSLTSF